VTQPPVMNEYSYHVEQNYFPEAWEVCRNKHLIGWNVNGAAFICEKSPVAFRLPGNKIVKLTEEIWKNNFYELSNLSDLARNAYSLLKFNLECKICDENFKKSQEFYSHVISETHKANAALFLEPYVVS